MQTKCPNQSRLYMRMKLTVKQTFQFSDCLLHEITRERYKNLKFSLSKSWRHLGAVTVVLVLNLKSGDEWLTSRPGRFTLRERAPVPKEWEAGWDHQSRSRRCGEEKNLLPLPGIRIPDRPVSSTVDIPTTPPRLPVVNGLENERRQDKIYRRHDGLTPSKCLALCQYDSLRESVSISTSVSANLSTQHSLKHIN
jgi:hypothetical protein